MRQGYLSVLTHPDHPGQIRLVASVEPPPSGASVPAPHDASLRYCARFNDLDAGLMHAHTALRRRLIDIDTHRYRADPVTAIAAVDGIALGHRQVYLDPEVAASPQLHAAVARARARTRSWDRIWNGVGILAVLFLLARLIIGF